jgi:hypothetical protein
MKDKGAEDEREAHFSLELNLNIEEQTGPKFQQAVDIMVYKHTWRGSELSADYVAKSNM